jgi:hypothetical protein
MSRSTANHQTVIRCDSPVCPSRAEQQDRFITYSIALRARLQARAAGWQRLPAWTVTTEDSPRRLYDICPQEAPIALERKANRPEILKAERAAKKAARIEAIAARARMKIEKQALQAKRKAEKIVDRERRAADRAPLTDAVVERILTAPPLPSAVQNGSPILMVVERMLRAGGQPMSVAKIVEHAIGDLALPTASRTPRTIVARDLAIDIKKHGESSRFVRVAPGMFTLRDQT